MKRLIKYNSPYSEETFSDCSTNYEVLPFIVDDNASSKDLRKLVNSLGLKTLGNCKELKKPRFGGIQITHNVKLDETVNVQNKEVPVFLGFATIQESEGIVIHETIDNKVTDDMLHTAICNCDFDIRDVINLDGSINLVIESWGAFHHFNLSGYVEFTTMLTDLNIEDSVFDDSVFQCSECGEWDWNDSGYTYNYRIIDCEQFGINCGCSNEIQKENYDAFINNSDECIEIEVANELDNEGELKKIETFIGGMVDGRGGYINGESVREGDPKSILDGLLETNPDNQYLFALNESGQFQTYFTVYEVIQ